MLYCFTPEQLYATCVLSTTPCCNWLCTCHPQRSSKAKESAVVVVADTTPPTLSGCPPDILAGCNSAPPPPVRLPEEHLKRGQRWAAAQRALELAVPP